MLRLSSPTNRFSGRSAHRSILVLVALVFLLVSCESPTGLPDIMDISQSSEYLWFVKSNHHTIVTQYNVLSYAYVTIKDSRNYQSENESLVLVFYSASGDTERVTPHKISVRNFASFLFLSGYSIWVTDRAGYSMDGVLNVSTQGDTIYALYDHEYLGSFLSIHAKTLPSYPGARK